MFILIVLIPSLALFTLKLDTIMVHKVPIRVNYKQVGYPFDIQVFGSRPLHECQSCDLEYSRSFINVSNTTLPYVVKAVFQNSQGTFYLTQNRIVQNETSYNAKWLLFDSELVLVTDAEIRYSQRNYSINYKISPHFISAQLDIQFSKILINNGEDGIDIIGLNGNVSLKSFLKKVKKTIHWGYKLYTLSEDNRFSIHSLLDISSPTLLNESRALDFDLSFSTLIIMHDDVIREYHISNFTEIISYARGDNTSLLMDDVRVVLMSQNQLHVRYHSVGNYSQQSILINGSFSNLVSLMDNKLYVVQDNETQVYGFQTLQPNLMINSLSENITVEIMSVNCPNTYSERVCRLYNHIEPHIINKSQQSLMELLIYAGITIIIIIILSAYLIRRRLLYLRQKYKPVENEA